MSLLFDAEPLLALLLDEPTGMGVESLLHRVERGDEPGAVSRVNLTEVAYTLARHSTSAARALAASLEAWRLQVVPCEPAWQGAARLKARHAGLSLGDAFAAATAKALGATLVLADDRGLAAACKAEGIAFRRVA